MESRRLTLPFLVALVVAASCGDDDGTSPPDTGSIEVTAATTGDDVDPDGYTIQVGTASQALGINASTTVSGLSPGDYTIELTGVEPNCTVAGDNPRTLTVNAGSTAATIFSVTCTPVSGALGVTASTSGSTLDPDGYTVTVDATEDQAIDINGSVTFADVAPGDREVELTGVASNCSVEGGNPRTITITAGETALTAFDVTCAMRAFLVTPIGFDFGEVVVGETSPQQSVEVTNVSGSSRTLNMTGGAAGVFGGVQNCQGATLAPGESCQISYDFEPTEEGEVSASTSGTINSLPFAFDFRGVGIANAGDATDTFLVTPIGFDFGAVVVGEMSPQQSVEVTNVSGSSQTLNLTGGAAGVFGGVQNCQGATLAPGESCQISYDFEPTEEGEVSASTSGTINGQSFAFDFRGVGLAQP